MGALFAVPPPNEALEGLVRYLDGRVRSYEETRDRLERLAARPDQTPEKCEELKRTLLHVGLQLDRWRSWRVSGCLAGTPGPAAYSRPEDDMDVVTGTHCRHCGRRASVLARGLCRRCYEKPTVRNIYPRGTRGKAPRKREQLVCLGELPPRYMPESTDTLPGTEERMDVYTRRLEAREHLYHPRDARRNADA